jgi:hypothetical protein
MSLSTRGAHHASAVSPHDTTPLFPDGQYAHALFVTVTGNVSFITPAGQTVSLTSVAANTRLDFCATHVRATGTTATVLALLYRD